MLNPASQLGQEAWAPWWMRLTNMQMQSSSHFSRVSKIDRTNLSTENLGVHLTSQTLWNTECQKQREISECKDRTAKPEWEFFRKAKKKKKEVWKSNECFIALNSKKSLINNGKGTKNFCNSVLIFMLHLSFERHYQVISELDRRTLKS